MPFPHDLRVRYGECDPQGIVFNPNYLAYFDHTVTELWRASSIGSWDAMVEQGGAGVVGAGHAALPAPARRDRRRGEPAARAGAPPRRRAADRGLAAAGVRRRQDLAQDRDPGLGPGRAVRLRSLKHRLRGRDELEPAHLRPRRAVADPHR